MQKIVFTVSDNGKKETLPEVASNLSRAGINPLLVTNAGIYGLDNRPLGLLISPKGKLHDADTRMDKGAHGNFSWDSAVFQISDDGIAAIVPAGTWQDSRHIVAATQSGPQLASAGKTNQSFQAQSKWSYRRTAIGVDQANRRLVRLVVSREPVTLFELAAFMVNGLHCSEGLHLDGDLSAFYVPSALDKFLFSDPGERIVTALSIIDQEARKSENKKLSGSPPKR
ncbi:MAG TPA: phosphodiester glycosidase family protein [Candidatus Angelobacter sp.]|nr:phosphodiester glycosidase family protein [Candidatus Angelobacter sp.]